MKSPPRTPTFLPGDPVCDALFDGPSALRNRDKQYREGPIETMPGIFSNDRRLLEFKDKLSRVLTTRFPESVDDFGRVSGNGVRSNFFGLRHVNGYPMIPATYPVTSNEGLREERGLANSFVKPWHELSLRALTRLMFSGLEPEPMKLRKGSSSMMPFYVKDMAQKQELASMALNKAEIAGSLMLKGDHVTPWTQFAIGGAYHTVYRRQSSDAIEYSRGVFTPKDRPVADLDFAISGGVDGHFRPASKELGEVDFRPPPDFFRERNRTAKGGPLGMNATLMPIAQALRTHIYHEYEYTFHHTTRDSTQQDVRGLAFTIAADVSNHDWYWPHFILDVVCDELLSLGFAEWWVKLYRTKSQLPDYVTDVAPDEGNILLGDWRKPSNSGGLPSGNAFTDIEGTLLMTWVYYIIQVEHTYAEIIPRITDVRSAAQYMDQYLKGKLPIRLKDKSDDALLGWSEHHLVPRARALLDKMQKGEAVSPYMVVSYEHGGAFLGSILLYPVTKDISGVTLIGNINSYVTNMFSPEYGVQSDQRDRTKTKRPYGGLAWSTMIQNYGSCPVYGEVKHTVDRLWSQIFGFSYDVYRQEWLEHDQRELADHLRHQRVPGMPDLTPLEIEVLSDPSKLEWKYSPEDVHESIRNMMFKGLPLTEVEPYFNSVIR